MLRATMSILPLPLPLPLQSSQSLKHLFSLYPFKKPLIHIFSKPRKITTTPTQLFSLKPLSVSSPINNYVDEKIDPTYLSCCMPHKNPLKVAVLVSGGVDSSVALRLLHAAGHSCTAFYLKIWFQEDFENFWSECPWEDDLRYAKAVCDQVDIPLEVVHLTDEYWKNVVSYIIEEYKCGRTPNPDVLCNTRIKFGAFMDAIGGMEFDFVASGHYARIVHASTTQLDEPSILELSKDMVKDQTYFLSHLSQAQLKRLIFPLGCIQKVRMKFACLPSHLIFQTKTERIHKEYVFLARYVVEKDIRNNVVYVSRNYFSVDKKRRLFRVGSLKWLSGLLPRQISELQCKVRHGPGFYNCSLVVEVDEHGREVAVVRLSEDDQGLAAGQFAAFYDRRICIGSGIILESWDDQGYPICARALEIARMEDKSKLGKPVKIMVKPEPIVSTI
ncbi:tRNA-specific 2-thiouridylase MnmA isoform X6 [Capsicum annuum]|uniref:tRNA-specific 2-thiouridylase MnmA isoform X6 n=1 Tax=Capsicum annuum TaxID=4072 RepID=UPI001FB0CF73|nr:tRNA-specific 2-thiouridylase MnmA isoform X6 [Capsicum annuum]